MADLSAQLMTLFSDVSPEFPNNTNTSFKVRLQTPLTVPNPNWEVALASLSVPNRGFSMKDLGYTSRADVLMKASVTLTDADKGTQLVEAVSVSVGDVFENESSVMTDAMEFWTRLSNMLNYQIRLLVKRTLKQRGAAIKLYLDQTVNLHVDLLKRQIEITMSANKTHSGPNSGVSFHIKLAKAFGLVFGSTSNGNLTYYLNPDNVRATQGEKKEADDRPYYYENSGNENWSVANDFLSLSGVDDWIFDNTDKHFQALSTTRARSILVYSDIVKTTPMGPQRHHLLRQLFIPREEQDSRQVIEPLHFQWIPIARTNTETVELELADLDGALMVLPPGKTVATLAVRPMQG